MKLLIISLITLISFSATSGSDALYYHLSGREHIYLVPKNLISTKSFIPLSERWKFDNAAVLWLIIPHSLLELKVSLNNEDNLTPELSVLVFFDKDYGDEKGMRSFVHSTIKELKKVNSYGKGYFSYEEILGDQSYLYLVTFDPYDAGEKVTDEDYFVTLVTSDSFKIGKFEFNPKSACKIHTNMDGFAIQISGVGNICLIDNLAEIQTSVTRLMKNWRVK